MHTAPLISTIHALALLPVALLFIYSFISGIKKWRFHSLTGTLAILVDLSISTLYILYKAFGGNISDPTITIAGGILAYFIVHGIVSSIVMALELTVIIERLIHFRTKPKNKFHSTLTKVLFFIWCFAFLSGELFYFVTYVLL